MIKFNRLTISIASLTTFFLFTADQAFAFQVHDLRQLNSLKAYHALYCDGKAVKNFSARSKSGPQLGSINLRSPGPIMPKESLAIPAAKPALSQGSLYSQPSIAPQVKAEPFAPATPFQHHPSVGSNKIPVLPAQPVTPYSGLSNNLPGLLPAEQLAPVVDALLKSERFKFIERFCAGFDPQKNEMELFYPGSWKDPRSDPAYPGYSVYDPSTKEEASGLNDPMKDSLSLRYPLYSFHTKQMHALLIERLPEKVAFMPDEEKLQLASTNRNFHAEMDRFNTCIKSPQHFEVHLEFKENGAMFPYNWSSQDNPRPDFRGCLPSEMLDNYFFSACMIFNAKRVFMSSPSTRVGYQKIKEYHLNCPEREMIETVRNKLALIVLQVYTQQIRNSLKGI